MALRVGRLEIGDRELDVMFQGLQGLVAEEFFDMVHVRATAEQFRGTRPPEGVSRDIGVQLGLP